MMNLLKYIILVVNLDITRNHQRLYKMLIKRDAPKLLKYINKNKYND